MRQYLMRAPEETQSRSGIFVATDRCVATVASILTRKKNRVPQKERLAVIDLSRRMPLVAALVFLGLGGIASAQGHPIPAPWQQTDVGDVGVAGSASQGSDADLFINGAGSDIWGTAD